MVDTPVVTETFSSVEDNPVEANHRFEELEMACPKGRHWLKEASLRQKVYAAVDARSPAVVAAVVVAGLGPVEKFAVEVSVVV